MIDANSDTLGETDFTDFLDRYTEYTREISYLLQKPCSENPLFPKNPTASPTSCSGLPSPRPLSGPDDPVILTVVVEASDGTSVIRDVKTIMSDGTRVMRDAKTSLI